MTRSSRLRSRHSQPLRTAPGRSSKFFTRSARLALTLSLVAEVEGTIVGQIAFSPVTISDGTDGWCGLGPVSVVPALQRQGVGHALVREGLSQMQALGAQGCVLLGSPAYYHRFGFARNQHLTLAGVRQEYFLALALDHDCPQGEVRYHCAFSE